MSEKGWTPEPWKTTPPECGCVNHYGSVSTNVYFTEIRGPNEENCLHMSIEGREAKHPNATRIVSCVNGCADIPKPEGLKELIDVVVNYVNGDLPDYYTDRDGCPSPMQDALRALGIEVE